MAQFLLLLREGADDFSRCSPAEMQAIIQKYMDWGAALQKEGRMLDGRKLKDGEGRNLVGFGKDLEVTDGPFGETKEVIGGFYLIEADDYEHAVELARGCPQLEHGGSVELRQIDLMDE